MEAESKSKPTTNVTDPRRRALLGGATTGSLVVAASVGALAIFGSKRAEASVDPGGYYIYNAVTDFGATGNGTTDDTASLQSAINAASGLTTSGGVLPLYVPPGIYKITAALTIPRYTKLFGAGRTFSTVIQPHACGLFIMDGSLYSGGFVEGISISDLTGDLTSASATNAVYINQAYNISIRDCFFNNSGSSVACSTLIQNCNDVVLDNTSICGKSTTVASNPLGLSIVGGTSGCTVKLIASDCEYFTVAMKTSGNAIVDMLSPYVESSLTNYYHGITSGQVNIYGGIFQGGGGAPYVINIQGDNLSIHGTQLPSTGYSTAALELASSPSFKNVKVYGSFNVASNSALASGANLASIEFYPPLTPRVSRGTVDFGKTMTSGSLTNLLSFATSDVLKCRLTIYAYVGAGNGCTCAQYDFILGSNGFIPNIVTSAISNISTGFWAATLTSPTLTAMGSTYKFALTATSTGSSGSSPVSLFGQLDYVSYDAGTSNVINTL